VRHGRTKLLYIAGHWRSGSTLLDRLLGHAEGFTSVGELVLLWKHGVQDNAPCSCGASFTECDFWRTVLRGAGGVDQLAFYEQLRSDMACIHSRLKQRLTTPWKRVPDHEPAPALADGLPKLYRAIATACNSDVVVDSSKTVSYALLLHRLPDIDLHLLHIVRDSRAVAYSRQRRKSLFPAHDAVQYMGRAGPLSSATKWLVRNTGVEYIKGRGVKHLLVRYEDLAVSPRQTLDRIGDFLGVGIEGLQFMTDNSVRLTPGHLVSGNPMRFTHGTIAIRPDSEWRKNMRLLEKLMVTAITSPMLLRYGYFDWPLARRTGNRPWEAAPGSEPAGLSTPM
jgi:hypothetical protein